MAPPIVEGPIDVPAVPELEVPAAPSLPEPYESSHTFRASEVLPESSLVRDQHSPGASIAEGSSVVLYVPDGVLSGEGLESEFWRGEDHYSELEFALTEALLSTGLEVVDPVEVLARLHAHYDAQSPTTFDLGAAATVLAGQFLGTIDQDAVPSLERVRSARREVLELPRGRVLPMTKPDFPGLVRAVRAGESIDYVLVVDSFQVQPAWASISGSAVEQEVLALLEQRLPTVEEAEELLSGVSNSDLVPFLSGTLSLVLIRLDSASVDWIGELELVGRVQIDEEPVYEARLERSASMAPGAMSGLEGIRDDHQEARDRAEEARREYQGVLELAKSEHRFVGRPSDLGAVQAERGAAVAAAKGRFEAALADLQSRQEASQEFDPEVEYTWELTLSSDEETRAGLQEAWSPSFRRRVLRELSSRAASTLVSAMRSTE